jgi:hypothetical protein
MGFMLILFKYFRLGTQIGFQQFSEDVHIIFHLIKLCFSFVRVFRTINI